MERKNERERKFGFQGRREEQLTCMFMALHPPSRPTMCHARIVCKHPNSTKLPN